MHRSIRGRVTTITFLMFDAIAKGFDFSVGYRKQQLTFLYIEDLAKGYI